MQYGLFTINAINAGRLLFRIEGKRTMHPSRYSLQIGENIHIEPDDACAPEELLKKYPWQFMNHSCEPTAKIDGQEVFALRSIRPLEEITFNYNTTEYAMAEPFTCHCLSTRCLGLIRGFKYLTIPERESLRPWLSSHILCIWESELSIPEHSIFVDTGETS